MEGTRKMRKIVFLDIDGVLVTARSTYDFQNADNFDPFCVGFFNHLIKETGAQVVISSTWRLLYSFDDLVAHFAGEGIDPGIIVGVTPSFDQKGNYGLFIPGNRGAEIAHWMKTAPEGSIGKFVILDDDEDMGELESHLIKTTWEKGLTVEAMRTAIERLT
jgi:hypothetical protein